MIIVHINKNIVFSSLETFTCGTYTILQKYQTFPSSLTRRIHVYKVNYTCYLYVL